MPFVIGREAAFSYTGGPEGTLVTTKFNRVVFRLTRKMFPTTPPGYLMERFTPGITTVVGALGLWYDSSDASFPFPGSAVGAVGAPSATPTGTLVITLVTGKTITFKASLTELSGSISTEEGGPPQTFQYSFISNAQATTDQVVTA